MIGVRCEYFKRKGPIIPYSQRKVATKLYVSDVGEEIPESEVLDQIYQGFSNIDKSLSEIRPLPRAKAANSGNHCYIKRYWLKLVSERNGEPPIRLTNCLIPFKISDWLGWRRQPKRDPSSDRASRTLNLRRAAPMIEPGSAEEHTLM